MNDVSLRRNLLLSRGRAHHLHHRRRQIQLHSPVCLFLLLYRARLTFLDRHKKNMKFAVGRFTKNMKLTIGSRFPVG